MIICFTTTNTITSGTFVEEDSVEIFQKKYPTAQILYVFENPQINNPRTNFDQHCLFYNFKPSDYRRKFRTNTGETEELIGFKPRNHKYPCIVWNETKQKYMKATPEFVHRQFEEMDTILQHSIN